MNDKERERKLCRLRDLRDTSAAGGYESSEGDENVLKLHYGDAFQLCKQTKKH